MTRIQLFSGVVLVLAPVLGFGTWWFVEERVREDNAAAGQALQRCVARGPQGFWVGDVANLFRLGSIPRDVAEADAAPLTPLLPKPRPYRGYLFVMLESGPSMMAGDGDPLPLQGRTWHPETFGVMAYPADGDPKRPIFLFCPTGFFRRVLPPGSDRPRRWPTDAELRRGWSRVC